ncbi:MAG TPA: glutamine--tRNA ligase/YqeY domain fusion protein [Candidatus Ratteibacteria bacterium]|nr:glutamine--tRNA ligase/YqeY domain fusion protein [Candidatus Ratteibacteria bacterium]
MEKKGIDFIREIILKDIEEGRYSKKVHTRFPPEPNGYLHIGHAKALHINYTIAKEFGGKFNLRMDDTDPEKETKEYVDAIINDVKYLGYDWGEKVYYASDYFDKFYEYAIQLIEKGKAYVCDLPPEKFKEYRGTLTQPGKESPYRDRTIEENKVLFEKMRNGEFQEGKCILRAKIDMKNPNILMRDPVIYRIKKTPHYRQGNKWCIYPTYDFAHCLEDSIEGITHSLCTIEFEIHRPLYDWFLEQLSIHHPKQIEFAPLNLTYTILSKRKLTELVEKKYVNGWDDPRMPTISGMRRRGYTPLSIKNFCNEIGISKTESLVNIELLHYFVRQHLNKICTRVMVVLNPIKIVITNFPEGKVEYLDAINNPEDENSGIRKVPFTKEIFIEKDDFMEVPVPKFYRLSPGKEIRLRYAYFIKCEKIIKNERGEIKEIHCTYDPDTKGGNAPDGRKVKATLHWVSSSINTSVEVRLYDHLFTKENMNEIEEGKTFLDYFNNNSLKILRNCPAEINLKDVKEGEKYQFERAGYFCVDPDTEKGNNVFNLTVKLKDEWEKIKKGGN